ncbi:uncharacterized protein LOC118343794 [Juglans regia]|uniref:Uncharacterized protein LOC118343794 n=1 Tax=Juglans regia TaxID=51240 RepID=A0A6P9E6I0_JUGRE|nr:uncharacterized protein LOC118343794 [Juglans regia]
MQAKAKVCELIDEVNRCWKVDIVNAVFSKEKSEIVRSIPISQSGIANKIVWGQTKNGKYSVRSAYHMVQQKMLQTGGEPSTLKNKDEVWTRIWGLNVPATAKLFMWRVVSDLLHTRRNLWKKKIVEDPLCPICKMNEETVSYVMLACPAAIDVWEDTLSLIRGGREKRKMPLEVPIGVAFNVNFDGALDKESMALWRAMVFCMETSIVDVIFEGDAKELIEAVMSDEDVDSSGGQIVEDIKQLRYQHRN